MYVFFFRVKVKNIFIAGGTGFVGSNLKKFLENKGYSVKLLSRSDGGSSIIKYPKSADELSKIISGSFAVINLAGASIAGKRWTEEYKNVLYNSRIDTTKFLVEAISKAEIKPEVFVSASAIGYYGDAGDKELTEESPSADGFVAKICVDWEIEAKKAEDYTKVFIPRIGVVLGKDGPLKQISLPFKLFVGGPFGPGTQFFSWVSLIDLLRIIEWGIDNKKSGVYNAVNPGALKVKDFAKILGRTLKRPSLFRVPSFVVKIVLGEAAQEVLRSQNIKPQRLKNEGFMFVDKDLSSALKRIYSKGQ